jgi:hypothetical protein
VISRCVLTHSDVEYGYVQRPVGLLLTFWSITKSETYESSAGSGDCDRTLSEGTLEGTNVERTEDLLGYGIRMALVKPVWKQRPVPPPVGSAILAFVNNYIVLESAVPFGH